MPALSSPAAEHECTAPTAAAAAIQRQVQQPLPPPHEVHSAAAEIEASLHGLQGLVSRERDDARDGRRLLALIDDLIQAHPHSLTPVAGNGSDGGQQPGDKVVESSPPLS
jgi:hypothetical protein